MVFIEAEAPRVTCRDHGVTVAAVPWARHGAGHTSKPAVAELMCVAWRTVGAVIGRVVGDVRALSDPFDGLARIGIDEISYKRDHKYLTVVVDHDIGRLIWAVPGRDMATLTKFFTLVGAQRCADIRLVSADAAEWIATVVAEQCPNATLCADPSTWWRCRPPSLVSCRCFRRRRSVSAPEWWICRFPMRSLTTRRSEHGHRQHLYLDPKLLPRFGGTGRDVLDSHHDQSSWRDTSPRRITSIRCRAGAGFRVAECVVDVACRTSRQSRLRHRGGPDGPGRETADMMPNESHGVVPNLADRSVSRHDRQPAIRSPGWSGRSASDRHRRPLLRRIDRVQRQPPRPSRRCGLRP